MLHWLLSRHDIDFHGTKPKCRISCPILHFGREWTHFKHFLIKESCNSVENKIYLSEEHEIGFFFFRIHLKSD